MYNIYIFAIIFQVAAFAEYNYLATKREKVSARAALPISPINVSVNWENF